MKRTNGAFGTARLGRNFSNRLRHGVQPPGKSGAQLTRGKGCGGRAKKTAAIDIGHSWFMRASARWSIRFREGRRRATWLGLDPIAVLVKSIQYGRLTAPSITNLLFQPELCNDFATQLINARQDYNQPSNVRVRSKCAGHDHSRTQTLALSASRAPESNSEHVSGFSSQAHVKQGPVDETLSRSVTQ
jgi:hypothetical protein